MPIDNEKRDLTVEQITLLMTWAKEHWYADCACLEAPCELVDTANGVALLIEQHARVTVDLDEARRLLRTPRGDRLEVLEARIRSRADRYSKLIDARQQDGHRIDMESRRQELRTLLRTV